MTTCAAGIPLIGRLAVPRGGLRIVLRHTFAVVIHHAEVDLRAGIPLIGDWPLVTLLGLHMSTDYAAIEAGSERGRGARLLCRNPPSVEIVSLEIKAARLRTVTWSSSSACLTSPRCC